MYDVTQFTQNHTERRQQLCTESNTAALIPAQCNETGTTINLTKKMVHCINIYHVLMYQFLLYH